MDINWGAFDGVLGIALVVIVIWAALKLVKRLVIAIIVVVLIGVTFFGMHWGDFFDRNPPAVEASDE
jgi:hypothetical protein